MCLKNILAATNAISKKILLQRVDVTTKYSIYLLHNQMHIQLARLVTDFKAI